MRWLIVLMVLCLAGCGEDATKKIETYAALAERFNAKLEVGGTWGDGHVAGQSFNFSGSHAYWKLTLDARPPPPPE